MSGIIKRSNSGSSTSLTSASQGSSVLDQDNSHRSTCRSPSYRSLLTCNDWTRTRSTSIASVWSLICRWQCVFLQACRNGSRKADGMIICYSGFTNRHPNHGFCSIMHSGSSGLSEDAPVCAIADQLLDGRVRSLQSCTGLRVVGLYGRASCTQSDMLSLCVSDLLSDYIMLHKYISQVSLVVITFSVRCGSGRFGA